ncbi:hypothetical protein G9A89_016578 [Geosiphon pyriformis]|nr:hypothetical protein G9A89_016578 [Geosiphon pyriformis]
MPTWKNSRSIAKTIDYIFVSLNLVNVILCYNVLSIGEHFDTDYCAVSMSISLGGLLDVQLNSFCKQANKDCWKFDIKSANKKMECGAVAYFSDVNLGIGIRVSELVFSTLAELQAIVLALNNKFKVATASDITTLEYYQLIYTHCKQQFEIRDGIIAFKKTLFQYIKNRINDYLFGNYNITTVKRDLLENILHYSNTESENISAEASENQSEHSETAANEENNSEITEEKSIDSENKEDKMTTYIAKIPDFNEEDIETSPQEWLDQVTKAGDANGWNATRMLRTIPYFLKGTAEEWFKNLAAPFNDWNAFKAAFLEQFTDNNTSITLCNHFRNIKQEPSESIMTYIEKFNKLFRWIGQLETNDYYSDAQILDQFIAGLKDKLIKKVRPHVPKDLNSAIQHAKRYEMAMKEANHTKLVNLAIGETSSAAEEKIDQLTKKVKNYFTNQQQQRYQPPQR